MSADAEFKEKVAETLAPQTLNEGPAAPQLGPDGEPVQTKSAAKKAAKLAEKQAKLAAKQTKQVVAPAAGGAKKEKAKKEEKVEEAFVNTTPKGEKKDVSGDLPKTAYNPLAVEAAWYDWWEAKGFFQPRYKEGTEKLIEDGRGVNYTGEHRDEGTFVIPIPPPNVTGSLHTGHALAATLQDTLIRYYRMKGYTTLYHPGFDHAGISCQAVVENRLLKTEGKSRHDYGREKFVEKVWDWKEVYQEKISSQFKRIGISADWNRSAFTLDERCDKAVRENFYQLHKKGLLYRANRLVNWCVKLNTTLSNLEVDQKDLKGKTFLNVPGYDIKEKFEFGTITSFAYEIEDTDERIVVATTRIETMLGDTAVAVHPDDDRYKHLIGKYIKHPFVDRRFPIVADDITVDMAFGTGAVKITPAHDPNDYECGKRNNLEFINLMNDDGTYNDNAGEQFKGMKRYHVRTAVLKALKEKGLYVETKDNPMQIPICSKSGDIIESIMKPQWWVNLKDAAAEATKRTEAGELKILPKSSEGDYYRWMRDMQDWCISRQLWWGHRCPAWLLIIDGKRPDPSDDKSWIIERCEEDAMEAAKKIADGRPFTIEQDDDVLDTWFSSGLWPFAIQGWPEKTDDMNSFYPASFLETGWDILPFWVARMVLLGIVLTDKMPFSEVYCHGLVRDPEGRKMSKSLGNVVDPIDLIEGSTLDALRKQLEGGNLADAEIKRAAEGQKKLFPKGIPQCGTDALRFALCNYTTGGQNILMQINDVEGYRKFCNKLWNATKFCMFKLDMVDIDGARLQSNFIPNKTDAKTGNETLAERWIFHKLNQAAIKVNKAFESRNFHDATEAVHGFWLYELCDVFIEATKPFTTDETPADVKKSVQNTIYTALESALRLVHPIMPYVSEDLWQRLPRRPDEKSETIMLCAFPSERADYHDPQAEKDFDLVFDCIRAARSIIATFGLPTNGKTPEERHEIYVQVDSEETAKMISSQVPIFEALIKGCREIKIVTKAEDVPAGCGTEQISVQAIVHVPVKGKIDAAQEISRLEKKVVLANTNADKIKKLQSQDNYETALPENVRQKNADQLRGIEAEIETLRLAIEKFQSLA
ncbi:valine-tRNA ligase [Filobasidium floriforme]|uniref:valine-tRNA ligase n=1 Tax=Filobasidium floriforme TaxID=5210 RepID=UPI001E8D69E1|nr:valine-tRNA ligase [Filobasidium floriforme]KAH8080852.1 valine-tRNA ligase [Filobasidium floriforme]